MIKKISNEKNINVKMTRHELIDLLFLCGAHEKDAEMTADEWLAIFEPVEDDSMTALNLTLSATAVAKFRQAAQQQQITQRALMERLINTL